MLLNINMNLENYGNLKGVEILQEVHLKLIEKIGNYMYKLIKILRFQHFIKKHLLDNT